MVQGIKNPNLKSIHGQEQWSRPEFFENGPPMLASDSLYEALTDREKSLYIPMAIDGGQCWRLRPAEGPKQEDPIKRMARIRKVVQTAEDVENGRVKPTVDFRSESYLLSLSPANRMAQIRQNKFEFDEIERDKDLKRRLAEGKSNENTNPRRLSKKAIERDLRNRRLKGENC